jgi:hypothetical protein
MITIAAIMIIVIITPCVWGVITWIAASYFDELAKVTKRKSNFKHK